MVKNIFSTFGSKLLIAVSNLLVIILISQVLGAEGKGEQSLIITLIVIILIFCDFIGGAALIYLTPRFKISKLLTQAYTWSILACTCWYFIIKATHLVPGFEIHILFISLLSSFFSIHQNILIGKENFRINNLISVLQIIILLVSLVILFFVLNNKNINSYIYALYFSFITSFIISFIHILPYVREQKSATDKTKTIFKKALKFGLINQTGIILQFLSFRISYFLINEYSGKDVLGVYSNGVSIVESIWLLSISISTVQYGKIANTTDKEYSKHLTINLTKFSMIMSIITLTILFFLPDTFFRFIFGNEFGAIHTIILYLMPGVFFLNFHLIVGHYFSGIGKYQINTYGIVFGFLVTAIMIFIFSPRFGISEAGITCSLSYITTSTFVFIWFLKESKSRLSDFLPNGNDIKALKFEIKNIFKK